MNTVNKENSSLSCERFEEKKQGDKIRNYYLIYDNKLSLIIVGVGGRCA